MHRLFDFSIENLLKDLLILADKKHLVTEYIWAGDLWGTQDPLTGEWNGIVFQVQYITTVG